MQRAKVRDEPNRAPHPLEGSFLQSVSVRNRLGVVRRILLLLFIAGTRVHNNRLDAYAGEVITIGIRRVTPS